MCQLGVGHAHVFCADAQGKHASLACPTLVMYKPAFKDASVMLMYQQVSPAMTGMVLLHTSSPSRGHLLSVFSPCSYVSTLGLLPLKPVKSTFQ